VTQTLGDVLDAGIMESSEPGRLICAMRRSYQLPINR